MRLPSSRWSISAVHFLVVTFVVLVVRCNMIEAYGESKSSSTVDTSNDRHREHSSLPSFDDYRGSSTSWHHVSCNSTQFLCENGKQCIDRINLCDRIENCDDGSDEGGKCDECQHGNGGCEQQCRNTPNGAECLCHVGWRPTHDGISCEDEDECASGHGYCQHYCHNTKGGFTCSCAPGYNLFSDGSTCKLQEQDAGFVLFSMGHQIINLPLNSWHELGPKEMPDTAVVCDVRSGTVDGLDTNSNNGHFYYTRNKGIYAHYEAEICVVQGLHEIGNNVAVDWVTGNLYWVKEDPASLGLCTDDGRYCTVLMNREDDLGTPRGLALHPKVGLMFWTDWGDGAKIERANMDGTDRRVIVDTQLVWPNAVSVDYVHNLLYFADSEYNLIERVRLDGSHREVVVRSGVFHPFDLVVFDDHVFWTDWNLHGVMAARISNESEHRRNLYHSESGQPYGIGILHPAYQQKDLPNPCKEAGCSHMCALTTHEYSHGKVSASCLCPLNYVHRDGNKKSECVPTNQTTKTGPHWCLDAFITACHDGTACKNGGRCKIDQNEHGVDVAARCECTLEFVGDFCEVALSPDAVVAAGGRVSGTKPWVAATLIFLTFVLVTCLCCLVLCRYGRYKNKLQTLRWSPSVIFRKTVMAAKNVKDCEQRQRIISQTEDGLSKSNSMCKSASFANPVYEEVQVPVHQHAYVMTRANSILSHDSDADSGLEFNTSSGSP